MRLPPEEHGDGPETLDSDPHHGQDEFLHNNPFHHHEGASVLLPQTNASPSAHDLVVEEAVDKFLAASHQTYSQLLHSLSLGSSGVPSPGRTSYSGGNAVFNIGASSAVEKSLDDEKDVCDKRIMVTMTVDEKKSNLRENYIATDNNNPSSCEVLTSVASKGTHPVTMTVDEKKSNLRENYIATDNNNPSSCEVLTSVDENGIEELILVNDKKRVVPLSCLEQLCLGTSNWKREDGADSDDILDFITDVGTVEDWEYELEENEGVFSCQEYGDGAEGVGCDADGGRCDMEGGGCDMEGGGCDVEGGRYDAGGGCEGNRCNAERCDAGEDSDHHSIILEDPVSYDCVEQFTIDENFDYDNVILSQKYTEDDLLALSEWRAGNQMQENFESDLFCVNTAGNQSQT